MATSLQIIAKFMDEMELKHKIKEGDRPRILTGFKTKKYRDKDGDLRLSLVIRLTEDGEYIKIYAPSCYTYKEGPHKVALFEACLAVSWRTKLIQFEYDPSDGEVRCLIEWPLEDAELTKRQLERCIMGIVQLLDEYHSVITTAIEMGKVVFPDDNKEVAQLRSQLQELLQKLDKVDKSSGSSSPLDLEE